MSAMRVHLGSDHAGLELKDHLLMWLVDHGYEAVDHGPFVYDALDDYPVFCLRAAEAVGGRHVPVSLASMMRSGTPGTPGLAPRHRVALQGRVELHPCEDFRCVLRTRLFGKGCVAVRWTGGSLTSRSKECDCVLPSSA